MITKLYNAFRVVFLSTLFFTIESSFADEIQAKPYIQNVATSSADLRWFSATPEKHSILLTGSAGSSTKRELVASTRHTIRFDGLVANTKYRYSVKDEDGAPVGSGTFTTAPPSSSSATIRFAVIGDSGTASPAQFEVARRLGRWSPQFIIHTGDIVYDNGDLTDYPAKFFAPYQNILRNIPLWPSRGNHDAGGDGFDAVYSLPSRASRSNTNYYYSFDRAFVHFIALDTNQSYSPRSNQHRWLISDLERAAKSHYRWLVVFFHYPPFSADFHGDNPEVQANLIPVFERFNVDLVLSGHDHAFERTGRINVTGRGKGHRVLYVVSGGGGAVVYPKVRENPNIVSYIARHHFLGIQATRESLAGAVIDVNGTTLHRFALRKPE